MDVRKLSCEYERNIEMGQDRVQWRGWY